MRKTLLLFFSLSFLLLTACGGGGEDDPIPSVPFELKNISIDGQTNLATFENVSPDATFVFEFSDEVNPATATSSILLKKDESVIPVRTETDKKKVTVTPLSALTGFITYKLVLNPTLKSVAGTVISTGKVYTIKTSINNSDKFPRISDDELLTKVQQQTFKFFWELGGANSGMARERNTWSDIVTTGGTGFGVMATVVASERNFVTRKEALTRVQKIVTFLDTRCTKYHGAFAHWINDADGTTRPFGDKDNGADLVETALLFEGLLTARAYFNQAVADETKLRDDITRLWEAIDWNWFQKGGGNLLYWHWSPTYNWDMNMGVSGWNEALIVYVLAASSPTHAITKATYDQGWARNGSMRNGKSFYSLPLPLGDDMGGPLFFAHYSFLGINPKNLTDAYADYWTQNKNHALIHYNYCKENPKGFGGYSENCWGLTACNGNTGYSAHSPSNDKGVIAPTAALSSFPYTPDESMKALHFYYYKLGDKIWKEYGFVDAFNLSAQWYDKEFLAIDQGPIIGMIENHRTGLLWNLFMSIPEVKVGMKKLGFESPNL